MACESCVKGSDSRAEPSICCGGKKGAFAACGLSRCALIEIKGNFNTCYDSVVRESRDVCDRDMAAAGLEKTRDARGNEKSRC